MPIARIVPSQRIDQHVRVALEEDRQRLDQLIVDGASTDHLSDVTRVDSAHLIASCLFLRSIW